LQQGNPRKRPPGSEEDLEFQSNQPLKKKARQEMTDVPATSKMKKSKEQLTISSILIVEDEVKENVKRISFGRQINPQACQSQIIHTKTTLAPNAPVERKKEVSS